LAIPIAYADASVTYKSGLKKGRRHSGITLSVYNLYNRRNIHSLYFEDDKAHAITLFPVLPSLSWAWSF
jgi:hypothetical protein